MQSKLTEKQEKFCQVYIETGNASEAYRKAYNAEKMKPETVTSKASLLLKKGNVRARLDEIKERHAKRHDCTVDDLLAELEEARKIALQAETPQTSAAISATLGKAKLLGFDKKLIEHSGSIATMDLTNHLTENQLENIAKEVMIKQGYEFDE